MTVRTMTGMVLAACFAAAFIAFNIWLSAQPDGNLLVRAFGSVPTAGGALLCWLFLVRERA